ncbi:MAG: oligosaccharide flippase family protein, partial [Paludibacteraceae bacterium]
MKEQIRKIARSELVRNSAKLLSANVIAQAIGLLVYPILTRLYSPEDFGLLNLFLSIGGVLVLLSTAEYQYAIVLP